MIEALPTINKSISKTAFKNAIERDGEAILEIINVGDVKPSKKNIDYYFFVDFLIKTPMIIDGVDVCGDVKGYSYSIKSHPKGFLVTTGTDLYPLIQHGLRKNNISIKGNFTLNQEDLKENLENLKFACKIETVGINQKRIVPIKEVE